MKINEIKRIRKSVGMSQSEFAKEIGVVIACVVRWEKGKTEPSPSSTKQIIEFCKKRNIPLEW